MEDRYTETKVWGLFFTRSRTEHHVIVAGQSHRVDEEGWLKMPANTPIQYQKTKRGSIGNINVVEAAEQVAASVE